MHFIKHFIKYSVIPFKFTSETIINDYQCIYSFVRGWGTIMLLHVLFFILFLFILLKWAVAINLSICTFLFIDSCMLLSGVCGIPLCAAIYVFIPSKASYRFLFNIVYHLSGSTLENLWIDTLSSVTNYQWNISYFLHRFCSSVWNFAFSWFQILV